MKTPTETPSPGTPSTRRDPSLKDAVAALPLSGSGPMSREALERLLEQGDARAVLRRCLDEMTALRGLVEVLRVAATEAQAPVKETHLGINALAETVRDQLRRLQALMQAALGELTAIPPGRMPGHRPAPSAMMAEQPPTAAPLLPGKSLSISGDGLLVSHQPPTPGVNAATAAAPDAFSRCYRYAYQALTDPEETARLIDDPVLSGYLAGEGLRQKGELYDAVAALLRVLDGRAVDSAAVRSALSRGFRKRGWPWPKTFEALRRHILTHTPESR